MHEKQHACRMSNRIKEQNAAREKTNEKTLRCSLHWFDEKRPSLPFRLKSLPFRTASHRPPWVLSNSFTWNVSPITFANFATSNTVMVGQAHAYCLLLQARVLKHFNLHASICLLVCLVACLTGYWYNRVHCCRAAG